MASWSPILYCPYRSIRHLGFLPYHFEFITKRNHVCSCVWCRWEIYFTKTFYAWELPKMRCGIDTEGIFYRYWPPRDASLSSERRFGFSLDRNASRRGPILQKRPSVAASCCISGGCDEKNAAKFQFLHGKEWEYRARTPGSTRPWVYEKIIPGPIWRVGAFWYLC